MLLSRFLFLELWRIASRHGRECLVLAELPWLFLFLSARGPLRWELLGDRRVRVSRMPKLAATSHVVPRTGPDDMIQKLATINLHHVWSRWSHDIDTDRLEHGLVTLPQAAILVDQGWRDWTQFDLEDISYINAALLPHD